MTKQNYNKLLSQFNQLQSQNEFNLNEIEDQRGLINENENEKMDLRDQIAELNEKITELTSDIGGKQAEIG